MHYNHKKQNYLVSTIELFKKWLQMLEKQPRGIVSRLWYVLIQSLVLSFAFKYIPATNSDNARYYLLNF